MWKSESIPFQRQDCRSRIGRALIVCISASEGSWNLIIVNHIQGSSTRAEAGQWRVREGLCTRVFEREEHVGRRDGGIQEALGR